MRWSRKELTELGIDLPKLPKPARRPKPGMPSQLFQALCQGHGLPVPVPEVEFDPNRRWRFDWCWPDPKIALEIEGGVWTNGAHVRGKHFLSDMEKYNEAVIAGWWVLRCTPQEVQSGAVFELLKRLFLRLVWDADRAERRHPEKKPLATDPPAG